MWWAGILASLKMYYHDVQGNPELGTEMMREHVMARADPADQPFLLSFLQTQMFSVYCSGLDTKNPGG